MQKKDILIIIGGLALLIFIVLIVFLIFPKTPKEKNINVLTDKTEYMAGEVLKIKIDNNLKESICFSSCYPYYIQKKSDNWENYRYVDCPKEDITENCVEPKQIKAFELTLPKIEEGFHRLAISACLGCRFSEEFKEDQKFYSNNFIVK
ncbi:MAG: hypothetical protein COU42_03230 [Candidatus Nealsonbacteria bacterium CG10_big_fil_rev_8_21_14_0_10_36_24]|uniref:Intracellular proteinase inhibitor BsuPI domain-containing protein n=2 Tax=Candidatus Nealsoniibacteriota TaxID=1817911 RepID=A0A2H0YNK1_9BACT|nr:MAG: hypothetical protein COU42_03230 [Candidatus Nealsonbacteria bacterium CG10_big_fil_rev_8_21_14_0_10_36_24]PIS39849.1 MAG: hypothetical protein COT32_02885 [Candidatus Nealsonbacteria bacterium CG08_land_8_20_14_0_20_36_22]